MTTEKLNHWLALGANIGVLIGLLLLVYEVRQNSALMRAQISMERTNTNMQILADFANGGDLIPIDVKLAETVEGFPTVLGWSETLTSEEKRRYEFWMFVRITELNNDWFQCSAGLVAPDVCQREVRGNMQRSIHRFHELGINFTRSEDSFIAVMQELARIEGLPAVNDDGSWH